MDLLALFIVASIIGGGLVAWVAIWTTNRASNAAITRFFKASEHILETGKPPPEWLRAPVWKRLLTFPPFSAGDETALARLDELIQFFAHCSFYEDEFAREQHLSQLEAVRQAWQSGKKP
ncbi:MAG: hypothetical protein OXG53_14950 [Chloroflexi bacterium]|nr:hypothetical protein [Chloroflexota bacterium]